MNPGYRIRVICTVDLIIVICTNDSHLLLIVIQLQPDLFEDLLDGVLLELGEVERRKARLQENHQGSNLVVVLYYILDYVQLTGLGAISEVSGGSMGFVGDAALAPSPLELRVLL